MLAFKSLDQGLPIRNDCLARVAGVCTIDSSEFVLLSMVVSVGAFVGASTVVRRLSSEDGMKKPGWLGRASLC